MNSVRSNEGVTPGAVLIPAEQMVMLGLWSHLDVIYAGFDQAAEQVTKFTGKPICITGCGICCKESSILSLGIEAEYAASVLIGNGQVKEALDRIREWLTKPGQYTYGNSITTGMLGEHWGEFHAIAQEPCCFLKEDLSCLIHNARPMACRAYGTTHVPQPKCPRALGNGEDSGSRASWDPHHPSIPLYDMVRRLRKSLKDSRYRREGFFASMIFERFAAKELAGLLDDGKVPMFKVACGIGKEAALLWQEQMDKSWSAVAAQKSINEQVPLVERNGKLIMKLGAN